MKKFDDSFVPGYIVFKFEIFKLTDFELSLKFSPVTFEYLQLNLLKLIHNC